MTRLFAHRSSIIGALVLALVLTPVGTASAHKFYASLAQVERTANGRLEIALRFFPTDLEEALRKTTGMRVAVEDSKAFAAAFIPWLNSAFALESSGVRSAFTYVGADVTVKTAWIYVEADWATPLDRSAMTNTILIDLFQAQVNTVNFVEGGTHSSQVFSAARTHAERLMEAQR